MSDAAAPSHRWLAGDLHVHSTGASNDTDDASYPEDIAEVARSRGLRWVVLTDHSNSTGSTDCDDPEECPNRGPEFPYQARVAALSDGEFLMVDGSEISPIESLRPGAGPVGHVGCLPPPDGFAFAGAFTDRPPGAVTGGEAVAQCRHAGGWAVVNHPFALARWVAYDWTTTDFDGLEVWNGGARWDHWDRQGVRAWECLVAGGREVVPIAASDSHRVGVAPPGDLTNPPLGQPRTSVRVAGDAPLDWPTVRAALVAGDVVLHEAGTFVEARLDGATWTLAGEAAVPSRLELRRISVGGDDCDPADPDGAPPPEVAWQAEVEGPFELDTGVASGAGDLLYAALTRDDLADLLEGDVAMTGLLPQAIRTAPGILRSSVSVPASQHAAT